MLEFEEGTHAFKVLNESRCEAWNATRSIVHVWSDFGVVLAASQGASRGQWFELSSRDEVVASSDAHRDHSLMIYRMESKLRAALLTRGASAVWQDYLAS